MAESITITLPDGSTQAHPPGVTPAQVAAAIGPGLARAALAGRVALADDEPQWWDLDRPIEASNPIVGDPARFIDPRPQFRQFCCPGCGRLIENEIAVESEPVLQDVEIRQ